MQQLGQDCTLDGLRGPSVVARDFANAAAVFAEAREVMPTALRALADKLSHSACQIIAVPRVAYLVAAHFETPPAPLCAPGCNCPVLSDTACAPLV